MARAVPPRASSATTWLLTGYCGAMPSSERRAAPLVIDEVTADDAEDGAGGSDGADSALWEDEVMEVDDPEAEGASNPVRA